MIQLSSLCTCACQHNHAAHCYTVRVAYILAERYRALADQIREYAQEQDAKIDGGRLSDHYAGKRTGANEIAAWLTSHADEVERHAR